MEPQSPTPPPGAPGVPGASRGRGVSHTHGSAWTPPDAGAVGPATQPDAPTAIRVEVEDADGPPMPPPARRRRRRRRVLGVVLALIVLGVPTSLAVAGLFPGPDAQPAAGQQDAEQPGGDDEEADDEPPAVEGEGSGTLDLEAFEGADAVYGRLLVDIDRSEQVMIGFQDEVADVFSGSAESPEQLVEAIQQIGATRRDALLEVRGSLEEPLPEEGAETVRDRYVAHLDSWADYMDAVAEDPSVLIGEGTGAGYTVVINATADAFARALEEEIPEDVDEEVRAFADQILDRGFRGLGEAQV